MTWPIAQVKTSFDQSSDDPKTARSEIAGNVDKFNQLQSHVSSYIQGLLDDADAAAARTTLAAQPLDATLTSLASVAGVAGDILFASGTDVWARLAKGTDGRALTLVSGVPSWEHGETTVSKTADETVNNSTTLQNDDHLLFALVADTTYWFDIHLFIDQTDSTPNIKFQWTVPTSCVMFWLGVDWASSIASDMLAVASVQTKGTTNSGQFAEHFQGFIRNGANAGNLQLQWAQSSAHASNTKLLKHSHLIIREIGAT